MSLITDKVIKSQLFKAKEVILFGGQQLLKTFFNLPFLTFKSLYGNSVGVIDFLKSVHNFVQLTLHKLLAVLV